MSGRSLSQQGHSRGAQHCQAAAGWRHRGGARAVVRRGWCWRCAGDIVLPLLGRDLCVEVKARADGFRELYCWLNQRDVLIVKADRQEPLVVVRLSFATEIAKLAAPTRCFATALKDVVGKGDGEKGDMT
jgi:hypothetical protein